MQFKRHTRAGTPVFIGSAASIGLDATIANAEHHADACIAPAELIAAGVENMPFKAWVQHNNLHTLVTTDDLQYRLRPLRARGRYIGLQLIDVQSGRRMLPIVDLADAAVCVQLLERLAAPAVAYEDTGRDDTRRVRLPAAWPAPAKGRAKATA